MEINKNSAFATLTFAGTIAARACVGYLLKVDPKAALVYTAVDMIVSNYLLSGSKGRHITIVPRYKTMGIVAGLAVSWLTVGSVGVLPALAMTISGYALGKLLAHPFRLPKTHQLHFL